MREEKQTENRHQENMKNDQNITQGSKPFIPDWLNEAGLSQSQFRLYCCLASRAGWESRVCWPEIPTIMHECRMAKGTFRKALNALEAKGLVIRLPKPFGGSNRYKIFCPSSSNGLQRGDRQSDQSAPRQRNQGATREFTEGYREEKKIEEECEKGKDFILCRSLPHGDRFHATWHCWVCHCFDMERPVTPLSAYFQIRELGKLSEEQAVEKLNHTIGMGWQGLMPPPTKAVTYGI